MDFRKWCRLLWDNNDPCWQEVVPVVAVEAAVALRTSISSSSSMISDLFRVSHVMVVEPLWRHESPPAAETLSLLIVVVVMLPLPLLLLWMHVHLREKQLWISRRLLVDRVLVFSNSISSIF
jgi:hypothetical protein